MSRCFGTGTPDMSLDTFFDNTYQCSYFLFVYFEWITTDLLIFHLCHYSMASLAALWLIPMGSMAMSPSSMLWSVALIWYTLHC